MPRLSLWHRFLAALPHLKRDEDKLPLRERLKDAMVKPADPDAPAKAKGFVLPDTVEELEAAERSADDKERLVGLLAAPVAGALALIVSSAVIADSHPALNKSQVGEVHLLTLVLLGLALAMLVTAWMRKRLLLGMVMALYGLSLFNLHGWGFAIPFLLFGSWLLVRAYRLHSALKSATADLAPGSAPAASPPKPSKRYTPPPKKSGSSRKPPPSKPEGEQRAG